jgi:hypothetical protein
MNRGLFATQINRIGTILQELGICEEQVRYPHFPDKPKSLFRGKSYKETWEIIYREQFYNFRLIDDSLMQFRLDSTSPLSVHYSYYECPFVPRISLEEFEEYHPMATDYDDNRLIQDYENYLDATNKDSITPIRYDFDPDLYKPCLHPASHLHFGHENSIRIGTRKILRPFSFLLLVIRQVYPDYWTNLLELKDANELCRNLRETLDDVRNEFWNSQDDRQLYLI